MPKGVYPRYGVVGSRKKHGMSHTPEHNSWIQMNGRCYNKNAPKYKYYGGRGITVCDRWRGESGFENYLADVGPKPSRKHTMDRLNNDGNYEPSNCRWATPSEQSFNRGACRQGWMREENANEFWIGAALSSSA